ncbi:MAG: carboxypeptidase-like regulatory domain-containing protein [Myxococcota bacterium]|nr:carboxypeptidase-like regulatory domain-containing protein [Myxococcota bacterium]
MGLSLCACQSEEPAPERDATLAPVLVDRGVEVDAEPTDAKVEDDQAPMVMDMAPPQRMDRLTIRGRVLDRFGGGLPNVSLEARCRENQEATVSGSNGAFSVEVSTRGCPEVILHTFLDGHSDHYARIALPTPTLEISMNVTIGELDEILCGSEECAPELVGTGSTYPAGYFSRAWSKSFFGQQASQLLSGMMRDSNENQLWFPLFHYIDMRNSGGARIAELSEPFGECFELGFESYSEIVDLNPETPEVTLNQYRFAPEEGRWHRTNDAYFTLRSDNIDENGELVTYFENLNREQLGDARAGLLIEPIWICGTIMESGWSAFGFPVSEKSCARVQLIDECETPLVGAQVVAIGDDISYSTWGLTNEEGIACLELPRSEVPSVSEVEFEDHNWNELGGETFFMSMSLYQGSIQIDEISAFATPQQEGICSRPESCDLIERSVRSAEAIPCEDR